MYERKFIPIETIRIRCGVSHEAYRLVDDVSRRTGATLGALVDNALRQTYGTKNLGGKNGFTPTQSEIE